MFEEASFSRLVPNACMVKDSPRKFPSGDADFGMNCWGELRHGRFVHNHTSFKLGRFVAFLVLIIVSRPRSTRFQLFGDVRANRTYNLKLSTVGNTLKRR